jgi:hypothetical protein
MALAEIKNIQIAAPGRGEIWNHGVEARYREFRNPSEKIKAIVGFKTHHGYCRFDVGRGSREEARKDFHKSRSDFGIAMHSKSWRAEAFKVERELDGIEWHQW